MIEDTHSTPSGLQMLDVSTEFFANDEYTFRDQSTK